MRGELARAIDEAAWPRALGLAIEAWRASRSPALADLIDAVSARCPREPAPRRDQQEHWMRAALAYDLVETCALLDTVHHRLHKGDSRWDDVLARLGSADPIIAEILAIARPCVPEPLPLGDVSPTTRQLLEKEHRDREAWRARIHRELPKHQRNRIERLAALARWPDDPRVASVLARWFADSFTWDKPHDRGPLAVLEILARLLERIADARVVPIVAPCIERPRARTPALRERQQELARRIVDALAAHERPGDDPHVVAWVRELAPPPAMPSVDEPALWRAVAQEPDALGPRTVLADFLLERGDPRGELIALQCSDDPEANALASKLLGACWNEWLGDLALVLKRGHCRFDRGVLVEAGVGSKSTPAWALSAVGDHRELTTVQRVSRTHHISSAGYVTFLSTLPDLASIELVLSLDDLDELAARGTSWPTRAIEIDCYRASEVPIDRFAAHLDRLATLFPSIEEISFRYGKLSERHAILLPRLAGIPSLRRVVLDAYYWGDGAPFVRRLAPTMPILELRS